MKAQRHMILTSLFSLTSLLSLSQETSPIADPSNYIRTDLISASPTVEKMMQFDNIPTTLFTGSANVSIPIYEISAGQLKIPITLDYSSSGFKPMQEASWVGLGWNLSVGGAINRTVRDKLDGTLPNDDYEFWNSFTVPGSWMADHDITRQFVDPLLGEWADGEPDLYSFNISGYSSGKFLIPSDTSFILLPAHPYTISGNPTNGFIIRDDLGNKFFFDSSEKESIEHVANQHESYNMPDHVSTYYLWKITAPDGSSITFEYANDGTIIQHGGRTQSFRKVTSGSGSSITSQLNGAKTSYPTKIANSRRLTRIVFDRGSIEFEAGGNRSDINCELGSTAQKIGSILIKDTDGNLIRKFSFTQSYFGSGSDRRKYLKLDKLKDQGFIGGMATSQPKEYLFNYENEGSTYYDCLSVGLDHFGYYRSTSSSNLIADEYLGNEVAAPEGGTNRDPQESKVMHTMLSEIIYPTGGSTEFEYELNRIDPGDDLTIDFTKAEFVTQSLVRDGESGALTSEPLQFYINHDQDVEIYSVVDGQPVFNTSLNYHFRIFDYDPETFSVGEQLTGSRGELGWHEYSLNTGHYVMFVELASNENESHASFLQRTNYYAEGYPGPGVRVRKIISNPNDGSPAIVKEYSYKKWDGVSTGITYKKAYQDNYVTYDIGTSMGVESYGTHQITSTLGMSQDPRLEIFYSQVHEYIGQGEEKIKNTYNFEDLQAGASGYNFLGVKPKSIINYKLEGNTYSPVKAEFNSYTTVTGGPNTYGHVAYQSYDFSGTGTLPAPHEDSREYSFKSYTLSSRKALLTQKIQKTFDDEGNEFVVQTDYAYGTGTHNYLISEETTRSGTSYNYLRIYKYPGDPNLKNPISTALSSNIKNVKLESELWVKKSTPEFVSGVWTEFNLYGYPVAIKISKQESGLTEIDTTQFEERVRWTYVANRHKVQDQIKNLDDIESYIWGYDDNYVIASVKNAKRYSCFFSSFEEDGTPDANARTGLNVRVSSMDSIIIPISQPDLNQLYVLSYWKYDSGTWNHKYEEHLLSPADIGYKIPGPSASSVEPIDEVRVYPKGAEMTTYTILPMVGVTSTTDPNGLTTTFEYDDSGKLIAIRDNDGNLTRSYEYNYASPNP